MQLPSSGEAIHMMRQAEESNHMIQKSGDLQLLEIQTEQPDWLVSYVQDAWNMDL